MTHTIKLDAEAFKYRKEKEISVMFTNDDDIVLWDKIIFQWEREELERTVTELIMNVNGLKKDWTLLVLSEPIQ